MRLLKGEVIAICVVLLLMLLAFWAGRASAAGMMGVGQMMQPTAGAGVPGGGFAIVTEGSDPLAAEDGSILVLESAP